MPNEVYRAAVDGLTALVPPRAAQRLVDESLMATHRTSDDVSLAAMRRLLLGPIRKELEGVIPPSAVGPGLKRVAAGLESAGGPRRRWWSRRPAGRGKHPDRPKEPAKQRERELEPERAVGTETPPTPALSAASKAAAFSGPAASVRSTMVRRVDRAEREAIEAAVAARAAEQPAPALEPTGRSAVKAPAAPLPKLDDMLLSRALKAFGGLESVSQIVAVKDGKVLLSEGEGADASALPALSLATSRLLGRGGSLKVFAIERDSGALFLFPLTGGGLVVLTKPKVNIGAVLAARATLEEAA